MVAIFYMSLVAQKGLSQIDPQIEMGVEMMRPPIAHNAMMLTWYGEVLHGNFMANGERFNMNDPLIAASPLLPFGTKIELWYCGKKLVVEVKDRMPPGTPTNQLDLSEAGARRLGFLVAGRVFALGKQLEN